MKSFFQHTYLYTCIKFCSLIVKKVISNKTEPNSSNGNLFLMAENLDDWIVKINGYKLHDNHLNTFRVENGILKVSYDQYDSFTDEFGHLFYKTPYTNYRLKLHYRFIGEQVTWR